MHVSFLCACCTVPQMPVGRLNLPGLPAQAESQKATFIPLSGKAEWWLIQAAQQARQLMQ
jgi:hypothetical protein